MELASSPVAGGAPGVVRETMCACPEARMARTAANAERPGVVVFWDT